MGVLRKAYNKFSPPHERLIYLMELGKPESKALAVLAANPDLDVNASTGRAVPVAASRGYAAVLRELFARGADVKAKPAGVTALHEARDRACLDLVLDHGVPAGARDQWGLTILDHLCMHGQKPSGETIRHLIARGADINARDKEGHTALHKAASWGNLTGVAVLLENGANVFARNDRDETPYHCAKRHKKTEAAALLWKAMREKRAARPRHRLPRKRPPGFQL
jgi:cytohesin